MHLGSHKRMKFHHELPRKVIDYSNVFAISKVLEEIDDGKYGSVTKDYESLRDERMQVLNSLSALQSSLTHATGESGLDMQEKSDACPKKKEGNDMSSAILVDSDDDDDAELHQVQVEPSSPVHATRDFREWLTSQLQLRLRHKPPSAEIYSNQLVPYEQVNTRICRDAGTEGNRPPSIQYEKVVLRSMTENFPIPNLALANRLVQYGKQKVFRGQKGETVPSEVMVEKKSEFNSSPTFTVGNQNSSFICFVDHQLQSQSMESHDQDDTKIIIGKKDDAKILESDGLEDLWKDMSLAVEYTKDATLPEESTVEEKVECCHSFVLKDDLGLVCRVCGVIQKSIDTIFDYQWTKGTQTTRTYAPGSRSSKDVGEVAQCKTSDYDFCNIDISIHPRHMKQMKPHQIEGFNFLVKNLIADPPGGCILAHAPGSGKTFMLISFIQSFLAKDSRARPLVVLPKGILGTWKKEFQRWQVENIPLYDFYSSKADNRFQQLDVLNSWHEKRSILFLGYKQFANIICDDSDNKVSAACQEKLLKVPTLLIMDEGHTPRNENTDVLNSIAKVRTPCKVVLSGTLFQNHVQEVFNILKLVRPNFMKTETSRAIVKRVMSKVHISGGRRLSKASEAYFCELVEDTLRNDDKYKRKIAVIQDLREMTQNVLHYYKGDFLDELPGLVDLTVLFNLSLKQKDIVQNLGKFEKFKRSSVGSAVYIHPQLKEIAENASGDKKDTTISEQKVDDIIDLINVRDGAKTKFFLNLLAMCESAGEKLLVFSQYLLPMKFLERLIVKFKGWRPGKEIFAISGDSSPEHREWSMEHFNNNSDAKVLFGSIKACGEGISLVGASRILILDVHLNPSVTRQAIGRIFRPGQQKKVYAYRLVAADSPEEEDHNTSFRKELISKMWFEWSEFCGHRDFELDAVDVADAQDMFLESPALREDIKAIYRR